MKKTIMKCKLLNISPKRIGLFSKCFDKSQGKYENEKQPVKVLTLPYNLDKM